VCNVAPVTVQGHLLEVSGLPFPLRHGLMEFQYTANYKAPQAGEGKGKGSAEAGALPLAVSMTATADHRGHLLLGEGPGVHPPPFSCPWNPPFMAMELPLHGHGTPPFMAMELPLHGHGTPPFMAMEPLLSWPWNSPFHGHGTPPFHGHGIPPCLPFCFCLALAMRLAA